MAISKGGDYMFNELTTDLKLAIVDAVGIGMMREADLANDRKYFRMLKSRSVDSKVAEGILLNAAGRAFRFSCLRNRNPGLSEKELKREYLREILTDAEFNSLRKRIDAMD